MLSKRLVGIFMLAGPILAIIMIILEQSYGRDGGSSFAEQMKAMSDNYALASIGSIESRSMERALPVAPRSTTATSERTLDSPFKTSEFIRDKPGASKYSKPSFNH